MCLHMNNTIRLAALAGMLLVFVAAFSSCSSTRQLGCPTRITQSVAPVPAVPPAAATLQLAA